ncbi:MAG: VPLPA-CTERM sorting domain-containing protein [Pseudomonadota bacterium]
MQRLLPHLAIAAGFTFVASGASAATETYIFDATLKSGTLFCGIAVSFEAPCPSEFGLIDEPTDLDDIMVGMSIGGTYPGRIDLSYDDLPDGTKSLSGVSCSLNGGNCFFDDTFLNLGPSLAGPAPGELDFSDVFSGTSLFEILGNTGTYSYSTEYLDRPDGSVYFYGDVQFDLTEVSHSSSAVHSVPLPAGVLGLLTGLGAFGWMRRRTRSRVA